MLVDDGREEKRTVIDERTAMSMQKELHFQRAYKGATVRASLAGFGQVRDERDVERTVGER